MATNNSINNAGNSFLVPANNLTDVSTPASARLNLFVINSINTTTVLTASDYGKEVICTGSSSYTVTLPTVTANANKFIDIFSQTTSNAIVSISPASGTIAGLTDLQIGTGDGVRVMNDGTNWWVLNQWLQPVSFFATLSATQSVANNGSPTVVFDTATINVGGFYNTSTGIFLTKLPGYYQIQSSLLFASVAVNNVGQRNVIFKAGLSYIDDAQQIATSFSMGMTNKTYMSLNGVAEGVQIGTFQNSGGSLNITATSTNFETWFSGNRVSLFA